MEVKDLTKLKQVVNSLKLLEKPEELTGLKEDMSEVGVSTKLIDQAIATKDKNERNKLVKQVIRQLSKILDSIANDDVNRGFGVNDSIITSNRNRVAVARFKNFKMPKGLYHGTYSKNVESIKRKGFVSLHDKAFRHSKADIWFAPNEDGAYHHMMWRQFQKLRMYLKKGSDGFDRKGNDQQIIYSITIFRIDLSTKKKQDAFLEYLKSKGLKLNKDIGGAFAISKIDGGQFRAMSASEMREIGVPMKVKEIPINVVIKEMKKNSEADRELNKRNYVIRALNKLGPSLVVLKKQGEELDDWEKLTLSLYRRLKKIKDVDTDEAMKEVNNVVREYSESKLKRGPGRKPGREVDKIFDAVDEHLSGKKDVYGSLHLGKFRK